MKRIILLFVAFITIGAYAQEGKKDQRAQHHENPPMKSHVNAEAHAMMYADKVTTRLNLSLEQKNKIEEAQLQRILAEQEMMSEMMTKTGKDSKMESRDMEIQKDFEAKMKNILTPAQFNEWEEMHEREMKMHHKNVYNDNGQN